MATSKSITALGEIELSLNLLRACAEAVHDANPENPAPWVLLVLHHGEKAENALDDLRQDVLQGIIAGGASC